MLVSVIIPALNEADNIVACIEAARRSYTPDEVEIIVVDGGSTDGTSDLVPDQEKLICAPRGRAMQMNRGAAASQGEILIFCHADTRLPDGWYKALIETLSDGSIAGGTFLTTILPERGLLLWLYNRIKFGSRVWWGLYGDQAQFMRRATFEEIGGFPEIPLMEDVEMARALRKKGKLTRIPLRVETSSRRFLEQGPWRQTVGNMWRMVRYLLLGATPQEIARTYRSSREEEL
jgi:rSAM/selenodomain-associated transferase 2